MLITSVRKMEIIDEREMKKKKGKTKNKKKKTKKTKRVMQAIVKG